MSLLMGLNVHAADRFVSFAKGEKTAIEITNTNDTIVYDPADWTGVRIAVSNLRHDIKAVTAGNALQSSWPLWAEALWPRDTRRNAGR